MQAQLQTRLAELRQQWETGKAKLHEMELQQAMLRETLLRIDGAITVLQELLAEPQPVSEHSNGGVAT